MNVLETLDKTFLVKKIKENKNLGKKDTVWIYTAKDMEDGTVLVAYDINDRPYVYSIVFPLPISRVEKNADTYESDDIHTPAHYHSGSVDVIGYGEMHLPKEQMEGSHRVNVLKYVTRYDKKGEPLKDLKKARVYLDKLIEIVEGDSDEL